MSGKKRLGWKVCNFPAVLKVKWFVFWLGDVFRFYISWRGYDLLEQLYNRRAWEPPHTEIKSIGAEQPQDRQLPQQNLVEEHRQPKVHTGIFLISSWVISNTTGINKNMYIKNIYMLYKDTLHLSSEARVSHF